MKFYESLLGLLREVSVQHVFGVPGDALNPLTEALREQDEIRWIRTAHEEGAAFAASAAAKLTGRLQVCAGTVGPGALHLINGLADANKDGAPVLAIMGQIPKAFRGSDYHQEIDLRRVFAPVCGKVVEVEDAAAAPHVFVEAIGHAIANRSVSALIVPASVGESSIEHVPVRPLRPRELGTLHPPHEAFEEAVGLLSGPAEVTIFAGEGSRGCANEVVALAQRLGAPIIRSLKARDLYPDRLDVVCGELGVVGSRAAVEAMRGCDVLLMVGTDYPYRDWYNPDCTAIQIDTRAAVIGRRSPRTVPLHADARVTVRALLERVPERPRDAKAGLLARVWGEAMQRAESLDRDPDRIHPQALASALAEAAPANAVFTCDTGTSTVWAARHLHLEPGQRLTFCANLGSMGYALPGAVGSALVSPGRTVVALCGDGAFNMLMGEFLTAVAQDLDLKVVILDNRKVGLIQLEQESEGFPEALTGQHNPDYAAFAAACGARGWTVSEPDALVPTLREMFSAPGPAILGVRVDPRELVVPPKVTLSQAWSFGLARARELLGGGAS